MYYSLLSIAYIVLAILYLFIETFMKSRLLPACDPDMPCVLLSLVLPIHICMYIICIEQEAEKKFNPE
jgi:hypothetical protein